MSKDRLEEIFKIHMIRQHIDGWTELSEMVGIRMCAFLKRRKDPGVFRIYELRELAKTLRLTPDEIVEIVTGERREENEE